MGAKIQQVAAAARGRHAPRGRERERRGKGPGVRLHGAAAHAAEACGPPGRDACRPPGMSSNAMACGIAWLQQDVHENVPPLVSICPGDGEQKPVY